MIPIPAWPFIFSNATGSSPTGEILLWDSGEIIEWDNGDIIDWDS